MKTPLKKGVKAKLSKNVLTLIREGHSITAACRNANVARSTFYRWRRKSRVLDRAIIDTVSIGEQVTADACEDRMKKLAIEGGHFLALFFLLTNLRPEKWKDRRVLAKNTNIVQNPVPPHERKFADPEEQAFSDKMMAYLEKHANA